MFSGINTSFYITNEYAKCQVKLPKNQLKVERIAEILGTYYESHCLGNFNNN